MAKSLRGWYWHLGLVSWLAMGYAIASSGDCVKAQITPDGTLPSNSVVTPQGNTSIINGGTRAGSNLLHSFDEFSVPKGDTAYFNNALDIQNIISRVTGEFISNIDGSIRANDTANLFLINPNGIILGPNASLDIGGSFVATTANAIQFGEQGFFSASTPDVLPVLTVNPSAFLFNQIGVAKPITTQASLRVPEGASLLLVGGNVSLGGGGLWAFDGRVELGGLVVPGTIGLNVAQNNLSLSFFNSVALSDVFLTNGTEVGVYGDVGGSITINAQNLNMSGGSRIDGGIVSDISSSSKAAGNIDIKATGSVNLTDDSEISNTVNFGSIGKAGDINITAGSLSVTNGARLTTSTYAQGDAGSVTIRASGLVSFDGESRYGDASGIFSSVEALFDAEGKGGDINITAESLSVTNGARLNASTYAQGNAGSVNIYTNGLVSFNGESSGIFSKVDFGFGIADQTMGKGGDINITARSLSVTNGAQLDAFTRGQGDAGSVNIHASGLVSFDGIDSYGYSSAASTSVTSQAVGNGGDINITAGSLYITNGAYLFAGTDGQGDAGKITVNTTNSVNLTGANSTNGLSSGLFTNTSSSGKGGDITVDTNTFHLLDSAVLNAETSDLGDGGNIQVNANTLSINNGALLSSSTSGQGNAGSVAVRAPKSVTVIGTSVNNQPSGLFTQTKGAGAGGTLEITTGLLQVLDGAQVSALTVGSGSGGTISVSAPQGLVELIGSTSRLTTETLGTEAAGNLTITTGQLRVLDGARISASTSGNGQGGTVSVTAPEFVILSGMASLSAQATANGNAGGLTINTPALTVENGAEVSAATTSSVGGDITLGGVNSLQLNNGGNISASTQTGRAGSVSVNDNENAADAVQLHGQGSGLFARATGSGDAGGLTINALAFTVADGAEATVSSQQGQAGNLRVTANSIFLDTGRLSAVTAKSQPGTEGANITLQVPDLLLMGNESRISADALETANGGNINIDVDFLIALPATGPSGSDIRANAFQGNGGKLNINVDGIFGIAFRPTETALNDITARSEFGDAGEVTFNTPDVDPSLGLVALPAELVDASGLIAHTCPTDGGQAQSELIVTGRGGLPENPSDSLSSDAVEGDLVTLYPKVENRSSPVVSTNSISPAFTQIVEAQGWVINNKGEVVLTASTATVTPQNSWITQASCRDS